MISWLHSFTAGSSPLARGLPSSSFTTVSTGGIIPARAGFTGGALADLADGGGSSPLARGLPHRARVPAPARGIIPARAGFTAAAYGDGGGRRDHPRSRGVYQKSEFSVPAAAGSSPLARGLPSYPIADHNNQRIIPARAGFTRRRRRGPVMWGDHPRSRGVYCSAAAGAIAAEGSSPLARGLQSPADPAGERMRIIPARAGFTPAWGYGNSGSEDHPRSRGVYGLRKNEKLREDGSSPLARGLPDGVPTVGEYSGIIPARAGFT